MSFPRYPKYKDSRIEWLGEVPWHWHVVQLKRLGTIRYGIGEPPAYHPQGTPLIRATNVHAGRLLTDGLVYVDPAEIPTQRIVWLEAGDIVVVRSGAYTGDSAIIPSGFGRCIAGFDMVLKLEGAYPPFVQYALLSSYLKERQIDLEKMRAAQPHLNAEELGSCIVILPTAEEQIAIAAFLGRETAKIDGLVAEQRRLIELLKEKRQAVISHLVTKGLNPNVPMKPSGIEWLGDVPGHWEVMPFKRVIDRVESGTSVNAVDIPAEEGRLGVLKTSCVYTGVFRPEENKTVMDPAEIERLNCPLRVRTLIVSRMNTPELVGAAGLVEIAPSNIYLPDRLWQVVLKDVIPEFAYFWTRSDIYRSQIKAVVTGTSSSMKNLGQSEFGGFVFVSPPIEEQKAIVEALAIQRSRFDALTAEALRAIGLLQERRTALISAAVTGKIDVRGLAKAEAA